MKKEQTNRKVGEIHSVDEMLLFLLSTGEMTIRELYDACLELEFEISKSYIIKRLNKYHGFTINNLIAYKFKTKKIKKREYKSASFSLIPEAKNIDVDDLLMLVDNNSLVTAKSFLNKHPTLEEFFNKSMLTNDEPLTTIREEYKPNNDNLLVMIIYLLYFNGISTLNELLEGITKEFDRKDCTVDKIILHIKECRKNTPIGNLIGTKIFNKNINENKYFLKNEIFSIKDDQLFHNLKELCFVKMDNIFVAEFITKYKNLSIYFDMGKINQIQKKEDNKTMENLTPEHLDFGLSSRKKIIKQIMCHIIKYLNNDESEKSITEITDYVNAKLPDINITKNRIRSYIVEMEYSPLSEFLHKNRCKINRKKYLYSLEHLEEISPVVLYQFVTCKDKELNNIIDYIIKNYPDLSTEATNIFWKYRTIHFDENITSIEELKNEIFTENTESITIDSPIEDELKNETFNENEELKIVKRPVVKELKKEVIKNTVIDSQESDVLKNILSEIMKLKNIEGNITINISGNVTINNT